MPDTLCNVSGITSHFSPDRQQKYRTPGNPTHDLFRHSYESLCYLRKDIALHSAIFHWFFRVTKPQFLEDSGKNPLFLNQRHFLGVSSEYIGSTQYGILGAFDHIRK